MTNPPPGATDYALLFVLVAIWGSSFLFIKLAVGEIPAATLTLLRLAIAAVLLLVIARLMRERLDWSWPLFGWIALAAAIGNALPFTLISWGEEVIDSGLAAILMAVMPLTTVLLAHVLTNDEKLSPAKIAGVTLGLLGLVVLIGPAQLAQLGADTWRQLAVASAAFCYGMNAMITRQLGDHDRTALVAWIMVVSALLMIPAALLADKPWTLAPGAASLSAALVLAVFHTAIATLIMFVIVKRQGASYFSQVNLLIPVAGVGYGALFLAERLDAQAYIALALILSGIAIARTSMGRAPGPGIAKRPTQK